MVYSGRCLVNGGRCLRELMNIKLFPFVAIGACISGAHEQAANSSDCASFANGGDLVTRAITCLVVDFM